MRCTVKEVKRVMDLRLIFDVAHLREPVTIRVGGQATIESLREWRTDEAGEGGRPKVIISGDPALPLSLCTPPEAIGSPIVRLLVRYQFFSKWSRSRAK